MEAESKTITAQDWGAQGKWRVIVIGGIWGGNENVLKLIMVAVVKLNRVKVVQL